MDKYKKKSFIFIFFIHIFFIDLQVDNAKSHDF